MSLETRISALITSIASSIKTKQATLVSGTNIKKLNNVTVLGSGNSNIFGNYLTVLTKTANYTIGIYDYYIRVSCSTVDINITLPTAPTIGTTFVIKKIDSTTKKVSIIGTVDGLTTQALTEQYDTITVTYNGTNWDIINKYSTVSKYF